MDHTFQLIAFVLAILTIVKVNRAATEVIKNGDFEYVTVTRDWSCQGGCTLTSSKDHYSRYHSVMVTNRHAKSSGLSQNVNVTPNQNYNFTAHIKLLTLQPAAMYDTVELMMKCTVGTHTHANYIKFGHVPQVRMGQWTMIGGIAFVPQGAHSCHVYVQVLGANVNYLVDHMSLQVLPEDPNWRTAANARIEKLRKADISVTLAGASGGDYTVELKQTGHEFAFGSAVGAQQMYDPAYKNYQNVFYDNFEWAVLENALKWRSLEHNHNQVNFTKALTAIHALKSNGYHVYVPKYSFRFQSTKTSPDFINGIPLGKTTIAEMKATERGCNKNSSQN